MGCDCEESSNPCDCTDGLNSFSTTSANYVQPAVNTNVSVSLSVVNPLSGDFAGTGQIIFIEGGGYYEVVTEGTSILVVKYTSAYTTFNQALAAAGATVTSGKKVSPGGIVGPTGTSVGGGAGNLAAFNWSIVAGVPDVANTINGLFGADNLNITVPAASTWLNTNGDTLDFVVVYGVNNATVGDIMIVGVGVDGPPANPIALPAATQTNFNVFTVGGANLSIRVVVRGKITRYSATEIFLHATATSNFGFVGAGQFIGINFNTSYISNIESPATIPAIVNGIMVFPMAQYYPFSTGVATAGRIGILHFSLTPTKQI